MNDRAWLWWHDCSRWPSSFNGMGSGQMPGYWMAGWVKSFYRYLWWKLCSGYDTWPGFVPKGRSGVFGALRSHLAATAEASMLRRNRAELRTRALRAGMGGWDGDSVPQNVDAKIDGQFLVSASCVTISNPDSHSSSKIRVNLGRRSWKSTHEWARCQKAVGGVYISQIIEEPRLYNLV
jgi:hypothetical protein